MNKILVIGSLNMDLVINAPRIPSMGETMIGKGFLTSPGGKGANQAVAAARLGGDVSMFGRVGDDIFGRQLVDNLESNNINVDNVQSICKVPTGVAVITIVDGDNYIILDPGANFKIISKDMDSIEDLIAQSDIIMLQLEIPLDIIYRVVKIAKIYGTKVILNPAPACSLSDELLSQIDVLTPNEGECEIITGVKSDTIQGVKNAAKYLLLKGVKQVVITMGSKGVIYNNKNKIIYRTAKKVIAVDTTAAGDSFSGALAYCLSNGKEIDESIEFAAIVGALTVTKNGAQNSLPYMDEIKELQFF